MTEILKRVTAENRMSNITSDLYTKAIRIQILCSHLKGRMECSEIDMISDIIGEGVRFLVGIQSSIDELINNRIADLNQQINFPPPQDVPKEEIPYSTRVR